MTDNLQNWQNATDNRFDFAKNAYLEAIPDLATANATSGAIGNLQVATAANQADLAKKLSNQTDRWGGLQTTYADNAFNYNSAARQQQMADRAMADVGSQFDAAAQQSARQLSRMGVNPSSGRSLALSNQLGIAKASAMAGAANKARTDLDAVANDRQKTALGFGANTAAQATNAANSVTYLGNAALGAAQQPYKNLLGFAGGIADMYGNAKDDYKSLYTTQNLSAADQARIAQTDRLADNKAESDLWGGALGAAAKFALAPQDSVAGGLVDKLFSSWS